MLYFRVRAAFVSSPPYARSIGLRWTSQRVTGNVEKWFPAKGYGFLKDERGHSYFVHRRYLKTVKGGCPGLRPGQSVSFTTVSKRDGRFHGEEVTLPDGASLPSVPRELDVAKAPSTVPDACPKHDQGSTNAPVPPGSVDSVTPHEAGDAHLTPRSTRAAAASVPPERVLDGSITACQREARLQLLEVLRMQAKKSNDSLIAAQASLNTAKIAATEALSQLDRARKYDDEAQSQGFPCEALMLAKRAFYNALSTAIRCATRLETAKEELKAAETAARRPQTRWESAIRIGIEAWRPALATYYGWPLVGGLATEVKLAESFFEQSPKSIVAHKARNELPFYHVMYPPHHGKSRFLDCLFRSSSDVVVAPVVTYDATDRMREWADFDMKLSDR